MTNEYVDVLQNLGRRSMKIGSSNFMPLNLSAFDRTQKALARSLERLSTGKHVSSPRDDPAAYSMSVNLDAQIRGLQQTTRNLIETQANLETRSSGIDSQVDLLNRMREIALSGSSSSISSTERENLNAQLQSLLSEYQRLAAPSSTQSTSFGSNANQVTSTLGSTLAQDILLKTVGNGVKNPPATLMMFDGGAKIQVGDVNNDGKQDVVTFGAHISIALGIGDGKFGMRTTYYGAPGGLYDDGVLIDMNNDGNLDIVEAQRADRIVTVHLGSGDGNFEVSSTFSANAQQVRVADVDGDGDMDVITHDYLTDLEWHENQGNGIFSYAGGFFFGATNIVDMRTTDVNKDGKMDILAYLDDAYVHVLLNQGDGSFADSYNVQAADFSALGSTMRLADMNQDGNIDIVVNDSGVGRIFTSFGTGTGSFGSRITTTPTVHLNISDFDIADLDGDGYNDVVANFQTNPVTALLYGNGSGSYTLRHTITAGIVRKLALADFNNDGVTDILTNHSQWRTYLQQTKNVSATSSVNVNSSTDAQALVKILDSAITSMQSRQSEVHALHSRLDFAASSNLLMGEALEEAKENMVSADMALTTAETVRLQILQQAQVAVRAQENITLNMILKLMG